MTTPEVLTWIAGSFCLIGIYCVKNKEHSLWISSKVALPLYSAGIFQWFLFGFFEHSPAIIITCGLQLVWLILLLRKYWKAHRS